MKTMKNTSAKRNLFGLSADHLKLVVGGGGIIANAAPPPPKP